MADSLDTSQDLKYHLALSLKGQTCIIVGFGEVGQRKLDGLLKTSVAKIKIFDPSLKDSLKEEILDQRVELLARKPDPKDLNQAILVFACTNDNAANERLALFCQEKHILCNCTSAPELGQIAIPAVIRQGGLTLTISTEGASPALSRKWRHELEEWVCQHTLMVDLMAKLRPLILSLQRDSKENSHLFRNLVASPLEDLLRSKQFAEAKELLEALLPKELHSQIIEMFAKYEQP